MNPLKPVLDYLEKARSRIYGIFMFWLVILHIPILFTSLFVDQNLIYQKYGKLKNEYVRDVYFTYDSWWHWGAYLVYAVGLPILLTWLMIWILPKPLVKRSYRKELEDQYEREFMKISKDEELNDKRKQLASEQLATVAEEQKVVKEQKKIEVSEEDGWISEYRRFKDTTLYKHFDDVPNALHMHYGHFRGTGNYGKVELYLNSELLSYLESNELATLDQEANSFALTKKGRFFLKNYQLDTAAK